MTTLTDSTTHFGIRIAAAAVSTDVDALVLVAAGCSGGPGSVHRAARARLVELGLSEADVAARIADAVTTSLRGRSVSVVGVDDAQAERIAYANRLSGFRAL